MFLKLFKLIRLATICIITDGPSIILMESEHCKEAQKHSSTSGSLWDAHRHCKLNTVQYECITNLVHMQYKASSYTVYCRSTIVLCVSMLVTGKKKVFYVLNSFIH